jgi:aminoglycoside 3-N-acetyltransferase
MAANKISKSQIETEIKALGVKEGDTLFLAADLLRVGYFSDNKEATLRDWVEILIKVVGDGGTLVIPAYTRSFPFFSKDSDIVFSEEEPTTSGSLSQAFQAYPGVMRSKHPTNSCFAIGRNSKYILDGHDERSPSYLPYSKVVELQGKNLMLGTVEDPTLAPMAMHCAQERLGLTRKHWLAGILQSYYKDQAGNLRLFTRKDAGGCSGGGHNLLGRHIVEKAITFGKVGRSLSACIDCKKSLEIFEIALKKRPVMVKCGNISYCSCCYGSPIYAHPFFWLKKVLIKFIRIYLK